MASATSTVDLSTATPQSIFAQPLPQVKVTHKALETALLEKENKLRSLVGNSYRELLGTAGMIIEMRSVTGRVEEVLGGVAEGCGRGRLEKGVRGLGVLDGGDRDRHGGKEELRRKATLRCLSGAVVTAGRLLRGRDTGAHNEWKAKAGEHLVTTARVLVLARLLLKSLGDGPVDIREPETPAELKRKLTTLRKRLLRSIERNLQSLTSDRDALLAALCAYSLTTSSGATDVLRHFLSARGQAIALKLEVDDEAPFNAAQGSAHAPLSDALTLYARTLTDVQFLTPRRLSEALAHLKSLPLIQDSALNALETLRLDILARHLAEDIAVFTPYIRHDDLDGPGAVGTLTSWSRKAQDVLTQGAGRILGRVAGFGDVVTARSAVFRVWAAEGGKARGFDSVVLLDALREVVNDRLVELLGLRVGRLHLVASEAEAALERIAAGDTLPPARLWGKDVLGMDISSGAQGFKDEIVARVYGRDEGVRRVGAAYTEWKRLVDEMAERVESLKAERWSDDIESLEDEDVLEARQEALAREDPAMLTEKLERSLEAGYQKLEGKLEELSGQNETAEATAFVIRILRDIRSRLPAQPDLSSFGLSLVPTLHAALAEQVVRDTVPKFVEDIGKCKRVVGRQIWEGEPPLPVYPSPVAFMFQQSVVKSAVGRGNDLWSKAAVTTLKEKALDEVVKGLESVLDGQAKAEKEGPNVPNEEEPKVNGQKEPAAEENAEKAETNGEPSAEADADADSAQQDPSDASSATLNHSTSATADQAADPKKDIATQTLFDLAVLQQWLGGDAADDKAKQLQDRLKRDGGLAAEELKRVERAAREYGKRTFLLLGPLA